MIIIQICIIYNFFTEQLCVDGAGSRAYGRFECHRLKVIVSLQYTCILIV